MAYDAAAREYCSYFYRYTLERNQCNQQVEWIEVFEKSLEIRIKANYFRLVKNNELNWTVALLMFQNCIKVEIFEEIVLQVPSLFPHFLVSSTLPSVLNLRKIFSKIFLRFNWSYFALLSSYTEGLWKLEKILNEFTFGEFLDFLTISTIRRNLIYRILVANSSSLLII